MWHFVLRGAGLSSSCDTYVFIDTNTDSLEFDSLFTGNLKVILAAESETGIGADVLAGRQGDFTASTDLLNDPQWIQYEADVIDLSVIVDATFNGIVGRFALDDIWYDIDMGEPVDDALLVNNEVLLMNGETVINSLGD